VVALRCVMAAPPPLSGRAGASPRSPRRADWPCRSFISPGCARRSGLQRKK
jgi:hypothetical protein